MSAFSKLAIIALAASASAVAVPSRVSVSTRDTPNTTIPGIEVGTIGPVKPMDATTATGLVNDMRDATTQVGRFKALLQDQDGNLVAENDLRQRTIFDFNLAAAANKVGDGGAIGVAAIGNFPILADSGVAIAMGFLGPCGMNTPHTHPRATEFLTLIQGERLESGFILENGFVGPDGKTPTEVRASITKNQGTVFPMGSNHWQFNPTCEPVTFVAALSNDDPGTSQIAQNFFNLDGDVIEATLGFPDSIDGSSIAQFKSKIPANVALIVEQCAQKCGYST